MAGKFKKADTSFNFGNNVRSARIKLGGSKKTKSGGKGRKPSGGGS